MKPPGMFGQVQRLSGGGERSESTNARMNLVDLAGVPGRFLYVLLGCPGTEVRINGERINGLFHLPTNGVILGVITH